MEIFRLIIEGSGALALTLICFTLTDMKERIVRIENFLFFEKEK